MDENSGGSLVYLSPRARLCGENGWAATLAVGRPIDENLNGIQNETDVRVVLGLGKAF